MKKTALFTALLILFTFSHAFSQDEKPQRELQTIFSGDRGGKVTHGGYAAITTSYSQIAGQDAFAVGGRAGWLINHHVTIGAVGQAFINSMYYDCEDYYFEHKGDEEFDGLYLVGGYAGLFVEPIIAPKFPIHVAFPVMIGGGTVSWDYTSWNDEYHWRDDNYYRRFDSYESDIYFVVEPGVEIELNLVKFMRVGFGVGYRYVVDLEMDGISDQAMNGLTGNFSLKFGKF